MQAPLHAVHVEPCTWSQGSGLSLVQSDGLLSGCVHAACHACWGKKWRFP